MILGFGLIVAVSSPTRADDLAGNSTVFTPNTFGPAPTNAAPGSAPPLVDLQQGAALSLVPAGSSAAARNQGLAGSPAGVDLAYTPPADRDSYLNSKDYANHLETSTRWGHHPSALSQLGGVAEGLAINGALGAGTSLLLGAH
ncbi:MAG TPA: hypothetical protein VGV37_25525 [Aliidongia sp.]|uniref:hypothetical protein n=1 Tax=Aliidongia sp. TaxID=1914230 RepID=UPI002DDD003C|nr:hypothetical protein [Aliidongia sp.]HEV2677917.1 hypothetical protein [Aliidongia sp.]